MCELFAVNAKEPVNVNGYLREFFPHSQFHPHGWGICWREDARHGSSEVCLHKEPVRAIDSEYLARLLEQPLDKTHLLAHIRLATLGRTSYVNCHPFVKTDYSDDEWMMVHNGTVFNDALITGYDRREGGDTDSERIIMFLIDLLDAAEQRAGGDLDFAGRFQVLNSAMVELSNGNKLNIILDDGEYLYVHTNTMKCTLWMKQGSYQVVFSTQPLDGDPAWQPVPTACLQAYRDGMLVRQAAPHSNIFKDCALEDYLLLQNPPQR